MITNFDSFINKDEIKNSSFIKEDKFIKELGEFGIRNVLLSD